MRLQRLCFLILILPLLTLPAYAAPITLGSASSFGLLGGTITNTGTSLITGDVGATTTVTMNGGTATGTVYPAPSDPTVAAAYNAVFGSGGAYSTAEGLASTGSFTTATSQTFLGGTVYASSGDISTITGTNLTFDALGDPTALFIIKINGAFTVNGAMTFTLEGDAQADNIFWVVGNSTTPYATISVADSGPIVFDGNILAGTFTMSAAAGGSGDLAGTINGCVFAKNANTLAGTTDVGGCAATSAGGTGPTGGGGSVVPEPGSMTLLGSGLIALVGFVRRRRQR
ncbi:MAG TPA: ice-binding family protein [Terracidiphilus sp.]